MEARLGHRPSLDGLRAIAVGAVLLYHADIPWMRGGYLGVDLFFVLSGFLITTLLLEEHAASGRVDIRSFWMRRARRLLPALVLVLAGIGLYAAFLAEESSVGSLRRESFAALGYVSNWNLIAADQSYFSQFSGPSPLQHMWSLAIEEQFYLFWPLLLPVLWKMVGRRRALLAGVIACGAAASVLWMAVLHQPGSDPSRVYYGTDTRAFGLLIGAMLAVVLSGRPDLANGPHRRLLLAASAPAVAVIALAFVFADASGDWMYPGGFLLIALCTAVVVAAAIQPGHHRLRRVLELGPLRLVGRVSYGLYLWHWPVFVAMTPLRTGLEGTTLFVARIAATAVLAGASYVLVEMPIRHGAFRARIRLVAPALAPALVAMVLVTTAGATTNPERVLGKKHEISGPTREAASATTVSYTRPTRVMIVGDSVAETLGWGLQEAATAEGFSFWNRAQLGCGLADRGQVLHGERWKAVSPECSALFPTWRSSVEEFRPDVTLLLFDVFVLGDVDVDGRVLRFGTPESDAYLLAQLDAGVQALTSRGGRVILLTAPYNRHGAQVPGRYWEEDDRNRIDHYNGLLRRYAAEHPDTVQVGDLNGLFCPGGQCMESLEGESTRWDDGVHFTSPVGRWAFTWLETRLRSTPSDTDRFVTSSLSSDGSVTRSS
jgi:peptidoglycan/LPS O-acetylase OafA/YrhL